MNFPNNLTFEKAGNDVEIYNVLVIIDIVGFAAEHIVSMIVPCLVVNAVPLTVID
jgi:hypothetical protein